MGGASTSATSTGTSTSAGASTSSTAGTASGSSSSSGSGGITQACESCMTQQCAAGLFACDMDPQCKAWLFCFFGCHGASCFDGCDAQYASAAALYKPIYACICNGCSNVCTAATSACSK
jgi:hypothetical protein